jgi:hypothetical protein
MPETRQLAIRSPVGGAEGTVTVQLEQLGGRARAGRALAAVGVGAVVLLVLLPVPGLHFGGVLVFLAALWYAAGMLRPQTLLRGAEGACPACGRRQTFFTGAGLRGVRWPLSLDCAECGKALVVEAPPS